MAQRRFMLVSGYATPGTLARWPGEWLDHDVAHRHSAGAWSAWRLLGANNRELGRSRHVYPDVRECAESVLLLQQQILHVAPNFLVGLHTGTWHWELYLGRTAMAVSARPFERLRDCETGYAHFVRAVPGAELTALATRLPSADGELGVGLPVQR